MLFSYTSWKISFFICYFFISVATVIIGWGVFDTFSFHNTYCKNLLSELLCMKTYLAVWNQRWIHTILLSSVHYLTYVFPPHPDLRSAHSNKHANSEWENHGNGKLLPMPAAPTPSPSHVWLVKLWLPLSTVLFVCGQNGDLDNSLIYCIKLARPYDGVFYRMQNRSLGCNV